MEDKKDKPKEKKLYIIIADAVIPIKAKYTVKAETEHEAIELIKKGKFDSVVIDKPKVRINHVRQLTVFLGNLMNRIMTKTLK